MTTVPERDETPMDTTEDSPPVAARPRLFRQNGIDESQGLGYLGPMISSSYSFMAPVVTFHSVPELAPAMDKVNSLLKEAAMPDAMPFKRLVRAGFAFAILHSLTNAQLDLAWLEEQGARGKAKQSQGKWMQTLQNYMNEKLKPTIKRINQAKAGFKNGLWSEDEVLALVNQIVRDTEGGGL